MKYLGYDRENKALRYTRYNTGKKIYRIPLERKYIEYHWKQIIEYLHQWQEIVKSSRRNTK